MGFLLLVVLLSPVQSYSVFVDSRDSCQKLAHDLAAELKAQKIKANLLCMKSFQI